MLPMLTKLYAKQTNYLPWSWECVQQTIYINILSRKYRICSEKQFFFVKKVLRLNRTSRLHKPLASNCVSLIIPESKHQHILYDFKYSSITWWP